MPVDPNVCSACGRWFEPNATHYCSAPAAEIADLKAKLAAAEKLGEEWTAKHDLAVKNLEKRLADAEEGVKNARSVIEILVGECSRTGTLSLSTMECARNFLNPPPELEHEGKTYLDHNPKTCKLCLSEGRR